MWRADRMKRRSILPWAAPGVEHDVNNRVGRVISAALLLLLQACDREAAVVETTTSRPRVASVEVLELQLRDWQHTIQVYGVVEATEEVEVGVEFAGTVSAVHFREGDKITRGDVLVELDTRKQRLRLEQAQSALDSAAAVLQEARSTLKRRRSLEARSVVSRELLENSETAVRRAAAGHDDALAALALAQREVDESRVPSPVDGVIGQREVEVGEVVLAGQKLATIQAVDAVRIVTFVSEQDVNQLQVGSGATVTSPGVRGRKFEADIESVGVKADPRTGNFPLKLSLSNADRLLRPGMTARVELKGLLERDRLLVPDVAVVDRDRRKVVYVVVTENGATLAREVHPLLRATADDQLPVIDGLSVGDRLIVSGLELLVDGSPVEVEPTVSTPSIQPSSEP